MKRPPRLPSGFLVLLPLVAAPACLAPAHELGQPWPPLAESGAETPWPWEGESATQPTQAQLGPQADRPGTAAEGGEPQGRTPPPLLSWDGGIVDGPEEGAVTEVGGMHRDLGKPGDRWHIIELYQGALKERDDLADEVAALSAALERSYELLDESEKSGLELTARVGQLQGEIDRLRQENEELAARLATAQIRRLEAEKVLLEAQIEAYRRREAEQGQVAMGDEK